MAFCCVRHFREEGAEETSQHVLLRILAAGRRAPRVGVRREAGGWGARPGPRAQGEAQWGHPAWEVILRRLAAPPEPKMEM